MFSLSLANCLVAILGDVFFIDEIHLTTKDTTLLMGLLRYIFTGGEVTQPLSGAPKLVFASATFECADINVFFPKFPLLSLNTAHFPIETVYRGHLAAARDKEVDAVICGIVLEEWVSVCSSDSNVFVCVLFLNSMLQFNFVSFCVYTYIYKIENYFTATLECC